METEPKDMNWLALGLQERYKAFKNEFVGAIGLDAEFLATQEEPVPLKILELANKLYEIEKLCMNIDPERVLLTRHVSCACEQCEKVINIKNYMKTQEQKNDGQKNNPNKRET